MCLKTKGMDRVIFIIEAAGQEYKRTAKLVYLGAPVCENADLTVEINRHVLLANLLYVSDGMVVYCTTSPRHRSGSKYGCSEVMETMLYGCVTWSTTVAHLAILCTAHHRFLVRCIGWKTKRRDGYHMLSYADALAKTGCENVETTVRKRRIRFAGFVARTDEKRLPKRVMFGQVDGGKGYQGGQEQDWMSCLERDLSLFNLPTEAKHWTLAAKKPGKWLRLVEEAADSK